MICDLHKVKLCKTVSSSANSRTASVPGVAGGAALVTNQVDDCRAQLIFYLKYGILQRPHEHAHFDFGQFTGTAC